MKANHTDITLVLDRSGSMAAVVDDTIGGFNTFIRDQKAAPGTADITAYKFDDEFETLIATSEIKKAHELTSETFVPRGNTALLDAIGQAINTTGKRLAEKPEHERAEKVVFVVITDGHENASREFNQSKIAQMIEHQRNAYKWEFVFMGANQQAITEAQNLGMNANNAINYAGNSAGTKAVFRSASSNLRKFRAGAAVCMAFTPDDYKAQADAGVEEQK